MWQYIDIVITGRSRAENSRSVEAIREGWDVAQNVQVQVFNDRD